MTCFEQAPDFLDYKEWCLNSWRPGCKKHDGELFILSDELRDKKIMKPTWQRWHVFEILEANGIEYNQVALVDVDTMIHPEAPNFFEETNHEYAAVVNNGCYEWVTRSIRDWGSSLFPDDQLVKAYNYINTGFIIANEKHKPFQSLINSN